MAEMLSYIFGSLQASEDAVRVAKRELRRQRKFNKTVAVFALVSTAYAITMELCVLEQDKKIEKLSKEIKELKHVKGD